MILRFASVTLITLVITACAMCVGPEVIEEVPLLEIIKKRPVNEV